MLRNFQFIYTERDLLKAIIDGWVMAERVALSPLSGLICEIVNSVGQGNFTVVRKRQGKVRGFQKPLAVATIHVCWHFLIARIFYGVGKTCAFVQSVRTVSVSFTFITTLAIRHNPTRSNPI